MVKKYEVGTGEDVGLIIEKFPDGSQYKLAKFYPFQPKLDENGNNPHVDLESQSIHQVLDPEGQIYKETIPFVERVRKVLLGLKNPTKEFLKEKGVVAWNVRQLLSLSQLE